jgi:hypothetical protein
MNEYKEMVGESPIAAAARIIGFDLAKPGGDRTAWFEWPTLEITPEDLKFITYRKVSLPDVVHRYGPLFGKELFPNYSVVVGDESGDVAREISPIVIVDNECLKLSVPAKTTDGPNVAAGCVESLCDPLVPQAVRPEGSIELSSATETAHELPNPFPGNPK